MKKYLVIAALFLHSIVSANDTIELVMTDGYQPLMVAPRISFFVTKTYTTSSIFPKDTVGMFIVTTNCTTNSQKRVLIEVYNPSTDTIIQNYKNAEEGANTLVAKGYTEIPLELKEITESLCSKMLLS